MAEPLGIASAIIAITGLAYSSCSTLSNTIKDLRDAPNTLRDLRGDLDTIQNLLRSLQSAFENLNEHDLSDGQKRCFEDVEPYICRCKATYDDFSKFLTRLTSHSDEDQVSWRDRGRLQLERRQIAGLKNGLQKDKETLDIAVSMATLRSAQQSQNALRSLERRIVTSMSEFSGEMRSLNVEMQSFKSPADPSSASATKEDINEAMALLMEQIDKIQQGLWVCDSGLKETSRHIGTTVETARVLDKAHQLIGNIGSGTHTESLEPVHVVYAEARDNSYQGVGNISDAALMAFLGK